MTYGYRTSFTAADRADREETIVDGRFSSSGDIAISDGSVTQGAIYFADDKNTGIYSPSNDSIAFTTAGSAALTIANNTATFAGDLTISNTSPQIFLVDSNNDSDYEIGNEDGLFRIRDTTNAANRLEISSTGDATFAKNAIFGSSNTFGKISILASRTTASVDDVFGVLGFGDGNGETPAYISCKAASTYGTDGGEGQPATNDRPVKLEFWTTPDTSATAAIALTLDQNQNATFAGDIKMAADKGIQFSPYDEAASSPGSDSNTLDDYEEGSFIPKIVGVNDSDGSSPKHAVQNGYYTKIGNLVTVTGMITGTEDAGTGNVVVENLPFQSNNSTNARYVGSSFIWEGVTTGGKPLQLSMSGGSYALNIYKAENNAQSVFLNRSDLSDTAYEIQFTLTYRTT